MVLPARGGLTIKPRCPNPIGAIICANDITRQKNAEEALRRSVALLRSVVEVTADWTWETDADACEKLHGAQLVARTTDGDRFVQAANDALYTSRAKPGDASRRV